MIVNEKEVIVELREGDPIIDVLQLIQGSVSWEGQSVNVSCDIQQELSSQYNSGRGGNAK